MANPYGRKGKGTAATLDEVDKAQVAQMPLDEKLAIVQRQLLALQNEKEEIAQRLQDALVNQATAAGGGSVPLLPDSDAEGLAISAPTVENVTPQDRADFGRIWLVRVFSDKAPGGVKIPSTVSCGRKAPNGKPAIYSRRFYTDTPVELPEWAIQTLEIPEEREYKEEVGSEPYEAAMRGDMGPAKEAAQKMGFESVVFDGAELRYIAYIRHYTVSRIAAREGHLFVPVQA